MELDLENPLLCTHDLHSDSPSSLFLNESDHMPSESYVRSFQALDYDVSVRTETISLITQFCCNFDPLLSYLAVNYLDRFLSSQGVPQLKPWVIKLLAVSCVSLAAKMKMIDYSFSDLQNIGGLVFDTQTIQRMEFIILGALKWRMRSITPFSFIPLFVSSLKLEDPALLRALKARAAEIIIRAQTEIKLLEFKPSVMAASSLLSASHELSPLQYPLFKKEISSCLHVNMESINQCFKVIQEMVVNEHESALEMATSATSPVNVLDYHCCSSSESETTIFTTSTSTSTTRSEREAKRRKISLRDQ